MSNVYEALQRARRQVGLAAPAFRDAVEAPQPPAAPTNGVPIFEIPAVPAAGVGPPATGAHLGRFTDAMTELFGAVRPLLDANQGTVLHIVATTNGEGVSTLAGEFAYLAATTGHRRTLLIDGDRRGRQTAKAFDCTTERGVIDSFWQQAEYDPVLRPVGGSLLSVGCLAGDAGNRAVDIESMRGLFSALRNRFELTVVDCPSIAGGGYADLIPEAADGIIFVVEAEKVRPAVIVHAKELVQQAGGNIIGAVLNRRQNYIPEFLYRVM
jgi:protein-tyrosine kinase